MRATRLARPMLVTCLLLVGCGTETEPEPGTGDGGAKVPITQRAIAAVALEHVSTDTSSREASYTDDTSVKGSLGADLRYGGDGESDGGLLRVFLEPRPSFSCHADGYRDGCEERAVDGGRLFLVWTELEPEEDPGLVDVVFIKDDGETVYVGWSGDDILGDPRKQDLLIAIDDMEAIAQDPRLSLTTTQDVVDLGEALDDWDGGEPDPTAYDRVPSTDQSLLNAYLSFHGGYASYSDFGSSPLKAQWGEGAVGGRMSFEGYGYPPSATIDVLAAPVGPDWLSGGDPCGVYAGQKDAECHDEGKGRYLAWTPGPDGEVWHISVRDDDVVGVRYGFDVPKTKRQVDTATEWSMINQEFVVDKTVGIETDKEMLDWDK